MKFSQSGSITVLLFVLAVFFAGCTGSDQPTLPDTTSQATTAATKTTGTPSATTLLQTVTTVPVTATENPVTVFNGDYHWVEYRNNNTVTMPPNPRYQWEYALKTERSRGNYTGIPAIHYKITATSDYPEWVGDKLMHTANGRIAVSDTYYAISTNKFLGGTWTETIKGVLKPADYSAYYVEHYREDKPDGEMGITPFGEMNITLAYDGMESVTVPAGTCPAARKYTGSVPVPVQYQFPNKYIDGDDPFQSYELKGWG
jgi:hypothetical protein